MRTIATKLVLAFLAVIVAISALFSAVGTRMIGDRIAAESEAEAGARADSAGHAFDESVDDLYDVTRFLASRFFLRNALLMGLLDDAAAELERVRTAEGLDLLTLTDRSGVVLVRTAAPGTIGDDRSSDPLVAAVLAGGRTVAGVTPVDTAYLERECPGALGDLEADGGEVLLLAAAAPVNDYHDNLLGVAFAGVVVEAHPSLVTSIDLTVFEGGTFEGAPLGFVAVYRGERMVVASAGGEEQPWADGEADDDGGGYVRAVHPIQGFGGEVVGSIEAGLLEAPYREQRTRSTVLFLVITLGGTLVVLATSLVFSRQISGPIRRLVAASQRVAAGAFDTRVTVTSRDELADLAGSFNTMALALEERMAQIADFATSRIKESERLAILGQLSAGVAHELNNPLQGVVAYAHLLLERTAADDPARPHLEKIVTQADRATAIIRALLDFARPSKPLKRPTDLNRVIDGTIALLEDQALFHDIHVVRSLHPALPHLVVDPSQMQQVFMNLFINAAEAMEGGGRLSIMTSPGPHGSWVDVRVSDTGRGIAAQDLERVFDPFFSTKDVMHGTGLGLAISYGIVREHGGTITVVSEVGVGTDFRLRLPVETNDEEGGEGDDR